MLRTASSLPLAGLLTLGFDPTRFQMKPPACYRATWQLPEPDSHRQATTSLRTANHLQRQPPAPLDARKIEASATWPARRILEGLLRRRRLTHPTTERRQLPKASRVLLTLVICLAETELDGIRSQLRTTEDDLAATRTPQGWVALRRRQRIRPFCAIGRIPGVPRGQRLPARRGRACGRL